MGYALISLDILRLYSMYYMAHRLWASSCTEVLLASHALTYCDFLYSQYILYRNNHMYCKLEFPHSPDAQMCTAIVVIQIQEHQNHYDYNYREILPDI
jgi:hypothetical protein